METLFKVAQSTKELVAAQLGGAPDSPARGPAQGRLVTCPALLAASMGQRSQDRQS